MHPGAPYLGIFAESQRMGAFADFWRQLYGPPKFLTYRFSLTMGDWKGISSNTSDRYQSIHLVSFWVTTLILVDPGFPTYRATGCCKSQPTTLVNSYLMVITIPWDIFTILNIPCSQTRGFAIAHGRKRVPAILINEVEPRNRHYYE